MNARKYKVTCKRPGGMGMPSYEGNVTVYAYDEQQAAEKGKREFARKGYFSRSMIKVKSVEMLYI